MSPIRARITYANVVSTLALLLLLSGGAALAAKKAKTRDIKPRAIKTKLLAPRAVKSGKLAPRAVKRRHIAAGSVDGPRIAPDSIDAAKVRDGSLTPADVLGGASAVAAATGGGVDVPLSEEPDPLPLAGGSWTQGAREINLFVARVDATLQSEGLVACAVRVEYMVDGRSVGSSFLATVKQPEPVHVVKETRLVGSLLPSGSPRPRVLTAVAFESGISDCVTPRIDAVKVVVLGIG
ncbi:MAG TPA: hypothetical protein VFZ41_06880 [Solirubrobacterales bacterium]